MDKLRATVLGLKDAGADLCAAVSSDPSFELVAVADGDKKIVDNTAESMAARGYDDYRSAIVEPDAQVIFMAMPPYLRPEYLKLAASRKSPVFMSGPPLPTLEACVEFSRILDTAHTPCCVSRIWQSEPAYCRLLNVETWAGRLFSAHVNVICPARDLQGWRGDSVRAGGGVLLNGAYDQVDALVTIMGMPEEVYTVLAAATEPDCVLSYDTEDAATVMMKFSQGRVATINCRRIGDNHYWRYRMHGTKATALITPEEMVTADAQGKEPVSSKVMTSNRFVPSIREFGKYLQTDSSKMFSQLEAHQVTMAVIKTSYLSAKTGQPESPARVYRMETGQDGPTLWD